MSSNDPSASLAAEPVAATAAPLRVLVLEPDADVRDLLVASLLRQGYEPILKLEGEGLPPDVILLEPSSRRARSDAEHARRLHPGLRIVCLSIYPREAALEPAGTAAYLVKPTVNGVLGRAIASALDAAPDQVTGEKR